MHSFPGTTDPFVCFNCICWVRKVRPLCSGQDDKSLSLPSLTPFTLMLSPPFTVSFSTSSWSEGRDILLLFVSLNGHLIEEDTNCRGRVWYLSGHSWIDVLCFKGFFLDSWEASCCVSSVHKLWCNKEEENKSDKEDPFVHKVYSVSLPLMMPTSCLLSLKASQSLLSSQTALFVCHALKVPNR